MQLKFIDPSDLGVWAWPSIIWLYVVNQPIFWNIIIMIIFNKYWQPRGVMMPSLSSLLAPEVVIMTTSGDTIDDKISIMISFNFLWNLQNIQSLQMPLDCILQILPVAVMQFSMSSYMHNTSYLGLPQYLPKPSCGIYEYDIDLPFIWTFGWWDIWISGNTWCGKFTYGPL